MPLLNPERTLRALRKTPVLIKALIRDLDRERALNLTDGPDGWNTIEIMCHLNDYETIFGDRVRQALQEDNPKYPPVDHEALVIENRYREQDLQQVFAQYLEKRRALVALLDTLTADQWARPAVHPTTGACIVLDQAINVALHDVTHLEQMARTLELSEGLL
jgi:hypothetical protein